MSKLPSLGILAFQNSHYNFNATILENALADSQTKLESYIDNNMTDPNVLDVIGGRQVIIKEFPNLPSSLPNRIVVTGARYDKIPQQLQQRTTVSFYGTQYQGLYGDKRTVTFPYARVNNEKLTLSFRPATQADEDTLNALIPDGNITDISQLPNSISANLINVVPELKLNGTVVATGVEMGLGTKVDIMQSSYLPGLGNVLPFDHTTVAGSYLSIHLVAQTVSPHKLKNLQSKLEETITKLDSNDSVLLASLNAESFMDDMIYSGTLCYYGEQQNILNIMALSSNVNQNIRIGHGIYGYEPKLTYLYGLAWTLSSGSIHVDLADLSASEALNGDYESNKNYRLQSGMSGSSLEHMVPEQMFNTDPANPVQGISTMKALQLANTQGQKIYTITQANADSIIPNLTHRPDVMSDIQAAVNAGYIVTTHASPVQVTGWTGSGYIIADQHGNGMYMISGGLNGGQFVMDLKSFLWLAIAATLGGVDGYTSRQAGKKFIIFDRLKYLAKMSGISKFLGATALILSSMQIFADENLSATQKAASIALNVVVFMATNKAMRVLVAFNPGLAAILGSIIAAILVTIGYYLSTEYLTYVNTREKVFLCCLKTSQYKGLLYG